MLVAGTIVVLADGSFQHLPHASGAGHECLHGRGGVLGESRIAPQLRMQKGFAPYFSTLHQSFEAFSSYQPLRYEGHGGYRFFHPLACRRLFGIFLCQVKQVGVIPQSGDGRSGVGIVPSQPAQ